MTAAAPPVTRPTGYRYGVLGFACSLSIITYLDRVCFGTVAPFIQSEFGLSDTQKGMLFSAFALAYAAFEVPSGWLGDRYGARRTLIRIVLWWSLFTAFTGLIYPSVLGMGAAFLLMLAVRFFFGMGEAGAYPNIANAFHNWFPFQERGFAKGAVWMAGRFAGGITTLVVLALIFETPAPQAAVVSSAVGLGGGANGPLAAAMTQLAEPTTVHWRHTFLIFGCFGVVWCLFFASWFRDRPEQKSGVNQAEIDLIHGTEDHASRRDAIPWGKILSSGNLWLLCFMYFCASYGWYFNITYLPGYLQDNFGVVSGPKWSGQFWLRSLMTGMPLLLGSVACLMGGYLSDLFIKKTGNRKWGRRLFGVVGHFLCAACYLVAILAADVWMFVLAIGFAAFWNDMTMGAAWASCLDIGKRYSGIVAGCMNTIGNLGGAAAGFVTGWILDHYKIGNDPAGMRPGWVINFCSFAGVYVIATLLWLWFDSTKPVVPEVNSSSDR